MLFRSAAYRTSPFKRVSNLDITKTFAKILSSSSLFIPPKRKHSFFLWNSSKKQQKKQATYGSTKIIQYLILDLFLRRNGYYFKTMKCTICNAAIFMFGVHELDIPLLSGPKLFYQNCSCRNKTKINFALFILLDTEFKRFKWLTYRTCGVLWCFTLCLP